MPPTLQKWAQQTLTGLSDNLRQLCETSDFTALSTLVSASQNVTKSTYDTLDSLARTSYSEMTRAHKDHASNENWRRIYTDARILRSLADVLNAEDDEKLDEQVSTASIARLDHAIIIAGPCGEGRLDLILELIRRIQSRTFWTKKLNISSSLSISDGPTKSIPLPKTFTKQIPRFDLHSLPSLAGFISTYSREPFILSGYASEWPAMQEHPWNSLEYLTKVAGPGRVVPVEVGNDYRTEDWTQTLMNWDEFLSSLTPSPEGASKEGQSSKPVLYLAQHNLFTQFPSLRDDIIVPDYVYAAPDAPSSYPGYHPPANDEQLVMNVWLGPSGTVSPAHTDPFFNFYAQVVGKKTVWLSSPETSPYMYPYPENDESGAEGTAQSALAHLNPAANNVEPLMSNTSRVDVFASDTSNYPLFAEHIIPSAMCATLEPGDLLFFPPGWWHALRSEEVSFSVSMWF